MQKILVFLLGLWIIGCTTLPTSTEYITRGEGYLKDGKLSKAVTAYNRAIALNAENLEAYVSRGTAHFFAGNFSLAESDFRYALAKDPYYADVYTALGSTLASQGNYKEALQMFEQAIALKPHRPENFVSRAGVYFMLERYPEALADYSAVLQAYPAKEVFMARGVVYEKIGNTELAKKDFEMARQNNIPETLEVYAKLK